MEQANKRFSKTEESLLKLEYPQAIALHTKSGVIMLDKEDWFSETIVIKRG